MFTVTVIHDHDVGRAVAWRWGGRDALALNAGDKARPVDPLEHLRFEAALGGSRPFALLRFEVEKEHAQRLKELDTPALERRLELAARRVFQAELPEARGMIRVHFEGPGADPVVHAIVLPTNRDGGPQRLLTRSDVQAMDASWRSELARETGIERRLQLPEERLPDGPAVRRVKELDLRWRLALSQMRQAVSARMAGEIPQEKLRAAIQRAQAIQDELHAARFALDRGRSGAGIDAVRVKVERGSEYLSRLDPKDADRAVLRAVQEASRLDPRVAHDLKVIVYGSGPDLRLTVYSGVEDRRLSAADLDLLRAKLENHLGPQLEAAAREHDSLGRGTVGSLGRVETLGVPSREGPENRRPEPLPTPALVPPAPAREHLTIEYRLANGAADLGRFDHETQGQIVEQAVDRALPFLKERGVARDVEWLRDGPSFHVRVSLPADAGWTRDELTAPRFEARFLHEIHRQVALRDGLSPDRVAPALSLPQPPQRSPLNGLADAKRALEKPSRPLWDRLVNAVPAPMRNALVLVRTISHVIPRE